MPEIMYNPLAHENIGQGIFEALSKSQAIPMSDIRPFEGSGIYSIYYHGSNSLYAEISKTHCGTSADRPLYVGKASTKGARTGFIDSSPGNSLHKRLKEHAGSISCTDMDIHDFKVKYLVLEDMWIHLAETTAITRSKPVWNTVAEGFGNHNPGGGRLKGMRPRWDTIHPGRPWAMRLPERNETVDSIKSMVKKYLHDGA